MHAPCFGRRTNLPIRPALDRQHLKPFPLRSLCAGEDALDICEYFSDASIIAVTQQAGVYVLSIDCVDSLHNERAIRGISSPLKAVQLVGCPVSLCVGVVAYFLWTAGIGVLGVKLASVVTEKTIDLSLPYLLDKNPRKPSRIEQRRIDLARAVPPLPVAKVAASAEPAWLSSADQIVLSLHLT